MNDDKKAWPCRHAQGQALRQSQARPSRPEGRRQGWRRTHLPPPPSRAPRRSSRRRAGAALRPAHGARRPRQSQPQDLAHAGHPQRRRAAGARRSLRPALQDRDSSNPGTSTGITGSEAVHQGVAYRGRSRCSPSRSTRWATRTSFVVLDQVTDPHNVGAILRSAVAFGAGSALITTPRHSPRESGVLAKSASGALEHIDHIEVKEPRRRSGQTSRRRLPDGRPRSEGTAEMERFLPAKSIALVLGAEGKGLREKTRATVSSTCPARHARPHPLSQVPNGAAGRRFTRRGRVFGE